MSKDIKNYIKTCERCLRFKTKRHKAELYSILATHPMELININCLTVKPGKLDNDINIMVVMDHFTRYAQVLVAPFQTAKVVMQTPWNKHFIHYRPLRKFSVIKHDTLKAVWLLNCVDSQKLQKIRISPYRLQSNGQWEWSNSTLISMWVTLPNQAKINWP